MFIQIEFIDCIKVGNTLGEGVVWRASDQTVWWTDIQECLLYRMTWPACEVRSFSLPERLGSFGLVEGDDQWLVCAFETGFALFEPDSGGIRWLSRPPELQASNVRLNDGKVAPDGSFWAGSMHDGRGELTVETGFYRLAGNSEARLVIPGLCIPNGLAWSPCGQVQYYADTVSGTVSRCDAVAGMAGPVSAASFAALEPGSPDGAAVDTTGRYWAALWDASKLAVYSPDGALLEEVPLPVPRPTCPAFGGPEGNILFVTSARMGLSPDELDKHPQSGGLFIFRTNACGAPGYRYVA
ncbi:MAG: SMP-30/gluconolactonase/LRE family protein [Hyphomonas sp.]